jgi:Zn-dependent M16 (insulinase) family peptidase
MNSFADSGNPTPKAGDRIGGYCVRRTEELEDIRATFYELEHVPTGARHIHIANEDSENTFGVSFKTVPTDSSGVAHILEHTVLCGSEKFPVRDPFFSMIKRSLNTFMNAFTASDWTMYPFSTQNRKDYYNLMDVYLDAAFFPKLGRLCFRQEGHRLEIEGERLEYKGVVYNEMKGAMSSPNQVMGRSLPNALYPDTTYANNSGGDPAVIPSLTHEQLKRFHERHYHPSNAWFYTYGNLPLTDHLAFIEDRVLKKFGRIDPQTDVPCQPRWESPKTVTYFYPLAKTEDPAKNVRSVSHGFSQTSGIPSKFWD